MVAPQNDASVYPPEFARMVIEDWTAQDAIPTDPPAEECTAKVLEILYQASFLREEGQSVRCRLVIAEPGVWKQGEGPPAGFHVLRFAAPRPFTTQEIRKLSPAASYYRTLIAIHSCDVNNLSIWGLIETGARWVNGIEGGRFDGAPLPPHFVAHILGPGRLLVACGYRRLLELNSGKVLKTGIDPFKSSWLPTMFIGVRQWLKDRLAATRLEGAEVQDDFIRLMAQNVVRRVLSLARGRGHGGMLIYLPQEIADLDSLKKILRIRCPFEHRPATEHFSELMLQAMSRLSLVGHRHGFQSVSWTEYQNIDDPILAQIEESFTELSHLFADLMMVDGALILTKRFEVVGFGGEVLGDQPVNEVYRSLDLEGQNLMREPADNSGTRHRAAYRFVSEVPGSLVIVLSQDGPIRFVTYRNDRVVYWPFMP